MIQDDMGREAQLLRCIPDIAAYQTLFYVGAHRRRIQMLPIFIDAGYSIDVIEVFEPNYQELLEFNSTTPVFRKVILDDIRTYRCPDLYDVVMWWHGPEHVEREELLKSLQYLESIATGYVVLACPWGEFAQPHEKNPYEEHLLSLYPSDFESRGYQIDMVGEENVPGSNLLSWKRIGKEQEKL